MNRINLRSTLAVLNKVLDPKTSFSNSKAHTTKLKRTDKEEIHLLKINTGLSGWLASSKEWKEFGGIQCSYTSQALLPLDVAIINNCLEKVIVDPLLKKHIYSLKRGENNILPSYVSVACFLGLPTNIVWDLMNPGSDPVYTEMLGESHRDEYNFVEARYLINKLEVILSGKLQ